MESKAHTWDRLIFACQREDKEDILQIVKHRPDILDFRDSDNARALAFCCREKLILSMETLLELGASVDASDLDCVNEDVVRTLIKHGLDPNHADEQGWSLLHTVCSLNLQNVAVCLVEAGANPLAKDGDGWSSLDICLEKNQDLARKLVAFSEAGELNKQAPMGVIGHSTRRI